MDTNIISYSAQLLSVLFILLAIYYRDDDNLILAIVGHIFIGFLIYTTHMNVLWVAWAYYSYVIFLNFKESIRLKKINDVDNIRREKEKYANFLKKELLELNLKVLGCMAGVDENGTWGHSPCKDTATGTYDKIKAIRDEIYELTGYIDPTLEDEIRDSRESLLRKFVIDRLRLVKSDKNDKDYCEFNDTIISLLKNGEVRGAQKLTKEYLDTDNSVSDIDVNLVDDIILKIKRYKELYSTHGYDNVNNKSIPNYKRMCEASLNEINGLLYGDGTPPPPLDYSVHDGNHLSEFGGPSGEMDYDKLLDYFRDKINDNMEEE